MSKRKIRTSSVGKIWTNEIILKFLELYDQQKSCNNRPVDIFDTIAKKLEENHNFKIQCKQLKKKYYNLIKTYKATKHPEKYPYNVKIREILATKYVEKCPTSEPNYEFIDTDLEVNNNWTSDETFHLLSLFKKNHQKFKNDSKKAFYQFLAYKMSDDGFQLRPVDNIARKFVNLQRSYRFSLSKKSITKFQFFNEMKKIQNVLKKSEVSCFEPSDDSDSSDDVNELIKISKEEIEIESKSRRLWSEDETLTLLNILKNQPLSIPNKWQDVSQQLNKAKYYRTPNESCRKLCNLKRTYRMCLKKFEETAEKPQKFPFFDEVMQLAQNECTEEAEDFFVEDEEIVVMKIERLYCKFCLGDSALTRFINLENDGDLIKKAHYLLENQNFDPVKTDSICNQCELKVLSFYDFKQQFEKASGFLKKGTN